MHEKEFYVIASDAHDAHEEVDWFCGHEKTQGAMGLIFLGDFTSPPTAKRLAERFRVLAVRGNNDGDVMALSAALATSGGELVPRDYAERTIADRKLFLTHYPDLAEVAVASGRYDLVCYGHDHEARTDRQGPTVIANPGELWRRLTGRASFAIWRPESNEIELVVRSNGSDGWETDGR